MTPNLAVVLDYVEDEYGLPVGVTNCRRISGSQTYSQHSWSNAGDIYTKETILQDVIAADLKAKFGAHVRNVLTWRYNDAHWNHIHIDLWPKGMYTPPCKGGALRVKHKDGTRGTEFTSDIEGGFDVAALQVENLQEALVAASQLGADGNVIDVDGVWGPNTLFAFANGLKEMAQKAGITEEQVIAMIAGTSLVPDETPQ